MAACLIRRISFWPKSLMIEAFVISEMGAAHDISMYALEAGDEYILNTCLGSKCQAIMKSECRA